MTFSLPLTQIDDALLESLRADHVREGRQLDYKETLPGARDDDKREFLSDVTSFANAAGGDIIYGLRERREEGKPTAEIEAVVGLPNLNVDFERLRLEAMIRDGVAPRMPPVTLHEIRRASGTSCLLLRVPRSWAGLHMVTLGNLSRFYSRTSGGKYQLDVYEIRAGFLAAEMAYERLRSFRNERVAQVLALQTPAPTAEGPKLILHALPVNSEEVWPRIQTLRNEDLINALPIIGGTVSDFRFNLDGFVLHTLRNDLSSQCYTQLLRSRGVEAVSGGALVKGERGGFYGTSMEKTLIGVVDRLRQFWGSVGVTPPLLVGLTLTGVRGWKVLHSPYWYNDLDGTVDRDVVAVPEVVLSDPAIDTDVLLRPIFDFVWNGGGWAGSPNYRDGRWVEPRR